MWQIIKQFKKLMFLLMIFTTEKFRKTTDSKLIFFKDFYKISLNLLSHMNDLLWRKSCESAEKY